MDKELLKHIQEKEQACEDRKAGKPIKQKPVKHYDWEDETGVEG